MIHGTRNSPALHPEKKSLYWLQTKSAWEAALKAKTYELGGNVASGAWKESCGPHSSVNCLMATMPDPSSLDIKTPGGWAPRIPDVLMSWFHTPSNQPRIAKALPGVDLDKAFENQFLSLYPIAVQEVLGKLCRYVPAHDFDDLVGYVKTGQAVQIVLIKPGHFVSVHAYDDFTDELIYVDPNDTPHTDGNWQNVRLPRAVHETNVRPWIVVYGG